ncbi:(4Fe-4S)-binding protein, partial [bacterium]
MKQIAIISGKGGTGKTTLTASLARIIPDKVMVDADVDASNLELLTDAKISSKEKYTEGKFALINNDKCTSCG